MSEQYFEAYCLFCEKAGHRTNDCWSTHAVNSRSNEIASLSTPHPETQEASKPEVPNTFKHEGESEEAWIDRITGASKEASKAVPVADERKPSDGDYLRWAEQAGAKVNWDFESTSSARVVFLLASQWGRFCDKVRASQTERTSKGVGDGND